MSRFFAIIPDSSQRALAEELANRLNISDREIFDGNLAEAAQYVTQNQLSPKYILIDIGSPTEAIFASLDQLAQNCTVGTKVVAIGDVNDLGLYRELIKRGLAEYFVKPVNLEDLYNAFSTQTQQVAPSSAPVQDGRVFSFISSSSGDGSTTVALNVAYTLASKYQAETVVVDMDYQFGLVARSLDLTFTAGVKDLYSQSDSMVDDTFVEKTIISYKNNLSIIPAPRELGVMPNVSAETMVSIIQILRRKYKYVIIDLPHVWNDWVAVVLGEVDKNVLVSQLSLKSVTHATRLLEAFENNGIQRNKTSVLINRSGSKLREPFSANEFSLVTKQKIDFYISNDSKAMASSDDKGVTAVEVGNSLLNKQFEEVAKNLAEI